MIIIPVTDHDHVRIPGARGVILAGLARQERYGYDGRTVVPVGAPEDNVTEIHCYPPDA